MTDTSFHFATGYTQDCPAQSLSFGYLQDNANQYPTNGIYYTFFGSKVMCMGDEFD